MPKDTHPESLIYLDHPDRNWRSKVDTLSSLARILSKTLPITWVWKTTPIGKAEEHYMDLWVDSGTQWLTLNTHILLQWSAAQFQGFTKHPTPEVLWFQPFKAQEHIKLFGKAGSIKKNIFASSCGNWSHGSFQFRPILYMDETHFFQHKRHKQTT